MRERRKPEGFKLPAVLRFGFAGAVIVNHRAAAKAARLTRSLPILQQRGTTSVGVFWSAWVGSNAGEAERFLRLLGNRQSGSAVHRRSGEVQLIARKWMCGMICFLLITGCEYRSSHVEDGVMIVTIRRRGEAVDILHGSRPVSEFFLGHHFLEKRDGWCYVQDCDMRCVYRFSADLLSDEEIKRLCSLQTADAMVFIHNRSPDVSFPNGPRNEALQMWKGERGF